MLSPFTSRIMQGRPRWVGDWRNVASDKSSRNSIFTEGVYDLPIGLDVQPILKKDVIPAGIAGIQGQGRYQACHPWTLDTGLPAGMTLFRGPAEDGR
jgi:hypothetical protein